METSDVMTVSKAQVVEVEEDGTHKEDIAQKRKRILKMLKDDLSTEHIDHDTYLHLVQKQYK